jgi:hypothetical protein
MEAKHTATPWTLTHIGGSNFAVQEFEIRGMFGDKPNVRPIFNKDRSAIDGATIFCSPEDAAFIVRACNAHDELVKALLHSFAVLDQLSSSTNNLNGGVGEKGFERICAAANMAEDALKAVGVYTGQGGAAALAKACATP